MVMTLYDETETPKVDFVGFITDNERFDFGIIHTNQFFGKPLVVCLQTGNAALLDLQDLKFVEYLMQTFQIRSHHDAEQLAEFLQTRLSSLPTGQEY